MLILDFERYRLILILILITVTFVIGFYLICVYFRQVASIPIEREMGYISVLTQGRKYDSKLCIITGLSNLSTKLLFDNDPLARTQSSTTIGKIYKTVFAQIDSRVFISDKWANVIDYLKKARPLKPINSLVFCVSCEQLNEENYLVAAQKLLDIVRAYDAKLYIVVLDLHLHPSFQLFTDLIGDDEKDQIFGTIYDNQRVATEASIQSFLKASCDELSQLIYYKIALKKMNKNTADNNSNLSLLGFWLNFSEEIYSKLEPFLIKLFHNHCFDLDGIYFSGKKYGEDLFLKDLFLRRILLNDIPKQKTFWPSNSLEVGIFMILLASSATALFYADITLTRWLDEYKNQILTVKDGDPVGALQAICALQRPINRILCTNFTYTRKEQNFLITQYLNKIFKMFETEINRLENRIFYFEGAIFEEKVDWLTNSKPWSDFKEYIELSSKLLLLKKNYQNFVSIKKTKYLMDSLKIMGFNITQAFCDLKDAVLPPLLEIKNLETLILDKTTELFDKFYNSIGNFSYEFKMACTSFISELNSDNLNLQNLKLATDKIVKSIDTELNVITDSLKDLQKKPEIVTINESLQKTPVFCEYFKDFLKKIDEKEIFTNNQLMQNDIFSVSNFTESDSKIKSIKEIKSFIDEMSGLFDEKQDLSDFIRVIQYVCCMTLNTTFVKKEYIDRLKNSVESLCCSKIQKELPTLLKKVNQEDLKQLQTLEKLLVRKGKQDLAHILDKTIKLFHLKTEIGHYEAFLKSKVDDPSLEAREKTFSFREIPASINDLNKCRTRTELFELVNKSDYAEEIDKQIIEIIKTYLSLYQENFLTDFKKKILNLCKADKSLVFPFKLNSKQFATKEQLDTFCELSESKDLLDIVKFSADKDYAIRCLNLSKLIRGDFIFNLQVSSPTSPILRESCEEVVFIECTNDDTLEYGFIYENNKPIKANAVKNIKIIHSLIPSSEFCFKDGCLSLELANYDILPLLQLLCGPQKFRYDLQKKNGIFAEFELEVRVQLPKGLSLPEEIQVV